MKARTRLARDLQVMQKQSGNGIEAAPEQENMFEWSALIEGPESTIWQNGMFELNLKFTQQYPQIAPKAKFVTPIFHPNVYKDGRICIDILDKNWSPVYDVWAILTSIRSMLQDPNPDNPANGDAAKLFKQDIEEYAVKVKESVKNSIS